MTRKIPLYTILNREFNIIGSNGKIYFKFKEFFPVPDEFGEKMREITQNRIMWEAQSHPCYINNLYGLGYGLLLPIREHINVPIFSSSCFRDIPLNRRVEGEKKSLHMLGLAMDFTTTDKNKLTEAFEFIIDNLRFSELILYKKSGIPNFLHIAASNTYKQIPYINTKEK
jgi:hypothetical protein